MLTDEDVANVAAIYRSRAEHLADTARDVTGDVREAAALRGRAKSYRDAATTLEAVSARANRRQRAAGPSKVAP